MAFVSRKLQAPLVIMLVLMAVQLFISAVASMTALELLVPESLIKKPLETIPQLVELIETYLTMRPATSIDTVVMAFLTETE